MAHSCVKVRVVTHFGPNLIRFKTNQASLRQNYLKVDKSRKNYIHHLLGLEDFFGLNQPVNYLHLVTNIPFARWIYVL
jgi:hypothetical protein